MNAGGLQMHAPLEVCIRRQMVNRRPTLILLECILVLNEFSDLFYFILRSHFALSKTHNISVGKITEKNR